MNPRQFLYRSSVRPAWHKSADHLAPPLALRLDRLRPASEAREKLSALRLAILLTRPSPKESAARERQQSQIPHKRLRRKPATKQKFQPMMKTVRREAIVSAAIPAGSRPGFVFEILAV